MWECIAPGVYRVIPIREETFRAWARTVLALSRHCPVGKKAFDEAVERQVKADMRSYLQTADVPAARAGV